MFQLGTHIVGLVPLADRDVVSDRLRQQIESALGPEEAGLRKFERSISMGMTGREILQTVLQELPEEFLKNLSASGAARLIKQIAALPSLPLSDIQAKKPERLVLELRDRGRAKTQSEWTATDLMVMGVNANMAAVYRVLQLAKSAGIADTNVADEASREMNHIFQTSSLHDMTAMDFEEFQRLGRKLKTTAEQRGLTRQSVIDLFNDEFRRVFGVAAW
jgi:hypothetical protein